MMNCSIGATSEVVLHFRCSLFLALPDLLLKLFFSRILFLKVAKKFWLNHQNREKSQPEADIWHEEG